MLVPSGCSSSSPDRPLPVITGVPSPEASVGSQDPQAAMKAIAGGMACHLSGRVIKRYEFNDDAASSTLIDLGVNVTLTETAASKAAKTQYAADDAAVTWTPRTTTTRVFADQNGVLVDLGHGLISQGGHDTPDKPLTDMLVPASAITPDNIFGLYDIHRVDDMNGAKTGSGEAVVTEIPCGAVAFRLGQWVVVDAQLPVISQTFKTVGAAEDFITQDMIR